MSRREDHTPFYNFRTGLKYYTQTLVLSSISSAQIRKLLHSVAVKRDILNHQLDGWIPYKKEYLQYMDNSWEIQVRLTYYLTYIGRRRARDKKFKLQLLRLVKNTKFTIARLHPL